MRGIFAFYVFKDVKLAGTNFSENGQNLIANFVPTDESVLKVNSHTRGREKLFLFLSRVNEND
jgi:hypothetical protein